ncbi:MAG: glutaminase A [Rhizomicrobium sp.]
MKLSQMALGEKAGGEPANALSSFLAQTHAALMLDESGAVADYIPELLKADPRHFGIALATTDGHLYEIGDAAVPFTIQSISKAFVFSLALEIFGPERVATVIGVEPSGDAFNSIRLSADNRPFNPMVNSGAIACSALIHEAQGEKAADYIRHMLGRFAGRDLDVDESVFKSERLTGDRNRAISFLLRNYGIIKGDVADVLDVYFLQCSVLVTARDLALMAATLANGGINPVTGERVVSPYTVSRTLSVMTSSGMYDYAGEWIYRVGIPAKSGVGGGILAALPTQFGLGSFSPRLDAHGNSVRGLKVCETLSSHFDLHMLNGTTDLRNCVVTDYDLAFVSPRGRQSHEQKILDEHRSDVRVLELTGTLTFANADHIVRRVASNPGLQLLVMDFRRVPRMSVGAAKILADLFRALKTSRITPVLSGVDKRSANWAILAPHLGEDGHHFSRLDEAIEWAEDQVIFRFGGLMQVVDAMDLVDQELLAGLAPDLVEQLGALGTPRSFHAGEQIFSGGAESTSLFFLQSGMVSVKLPDGVRLATLVPGTAFGEMALFEKKRTADVWADSAVRCIELPLQRFFQFRDSHPQIGEQIMRNLAGLLVRRLGRANRRIDLLSSH